MLGIWVTGRRIAAQEHSLWRDARSRRCHRLHATPTKSCRIAASGQGRPMGADMSNAAMRLRIIDGVQDLWLRRLRAPCHRLCSNMRYAHTTDTTHHTQRRGIAASHFSGQETGDRTPPHRGIGIRVTERRRIAAQEHSLWRGARSRRCHRTHATPTKSCRIAASVQGRPWAGYMGYAAMRLWMIYAFKTCGCGGYAPYHRLYSIMRYAHTTGTTHPTQRCGIAASRFSG